MKGWVKGGLISFGVLLILFIFSLIGYLFNSVLGLWMFVKILLFPIRTIQKIFPAFAFGTTLNAIISIIFYIFLGAIIGLITVKKKPKIEEKEKAGGKVE